MNNQKFFTLFLVIVFLSVVRINGVNAQESSDENTSFGVYSAGLSLGWYNPSLDYWKEKSEFKDADFKGAIDVKGLMDLRLVRDLHLRVGVEYWQTSVEEDLQGFGETKLFLTGVPVTLDMLYYARPIRFSVITPFIGINGAYTFINYKLDFRDKDNPEPRSGSTFVGSGIIGLQAKLSDSFALDLEFDYKFGNYDQDFTVEIIDPENPDEPEYKVVTETISLGGPFVGLTLKYLF
jgi:hypothetical protein